jgi:hypothetical protein
MNKKMQKTIQSLQAMLAMVCVSLVSLTACSDDDEPVAEVTYSWEFEEVSPSTPDFMDDKNKIESAFKTALGATGTATSVTRQGTPETCDKEVREACQQAFNSLKDEAWQGRYTFTVTNVTTGTVIFSHTFDADNENSGKSYTASDLKPGDYIYDNGMTSDGGLRGINDDGTIEWAEPKPQPESGKTVVGVVFWTPSETTTNGRKTPASLTDDKIMSAEHPDCTRGLAVAVKKVTYNGSETMVWQPYGSYEFVNAWQEGYRFTHANKDKFVSITSGTGADHNINRIYGYQNTVVLRAYNAYCQKTKGKQGYIVRPVAALDEFVNGNACPAPAGSTGWFLPSVKELHMLCYKDVDDVRNEYDASFTGDPFYTITRDIVNSSLATAGGDALIPDPYRSSTEGWGYSNNAFYVYFLNARVNYSNKYDVFRVRAVCAF